jgi:hypothetical protein
LWTYLHLWSKSFPTKPTHAQKLSMSTTLLAILSTLPCNLCVDNASRNLDKVGFATPHTPHNLAKSKFMKSRETFTRFVFDLHNQVSQMLGKDTSGIDFDEVMEDLEIGRAKACTTKVQRQDGVESGCTEPKYKACKTQIYIVERKNHKDHSLQGGAQSTERNLNMDLNL